MSRRTKMLFGLLGVMGVAIAMAIWIGTNRQNRLLANATARLLDAETEPGSIADSELSRLPAPVARYLRRAMPSRTQIQDVRIRQTGTLRTDLASDRWMPFNAEHLVVPNATGFLWNARVRVAPLLHVRVLDSLIAGNGSGHVSLMSAFTVSESAGGVEMNAGSLHRYLAEAVWYPTALWPSANLRWTEIDETRALATLTNSGVTVSLEFRFSGDGEVTGIYTPGRWGSFPEGFRQVPWEGRFRDYRERDGLFVPTEGEVGWYLNNEWRSVWKGTVIDYQVRFRD